MGDQIVIFSVSLISLFLLILNSILFLLTNKNKNDIYKTLTVYLLAMAITESFCNYIGFMEPGNNLFISHIYFNSQFLFLSVFFYKLFENKLLKRIIIANLIILWIVLIFQYVSNPALFWIFNLLEILTISFLLIVYAFINLYQCLGESKRYYYFSIGLIMYLLCSSIIFMSGNLDLVFVEKPIIDIWIFNSLLYIVYQLLILKEWRLLNNKSSNEY